jgi:hypothetical protein
LESLLASFSEPATINTLVREDGPSFVHVRNVERTTLGMHPIGLQNANNESRTEHRWELVLFRKTS